MSHESWLSSSMCWHYVSFCLFYQHNIYSGKAEGMFIYRINWQGNLFPTEGKSLNKSMLNSDKCYMLDCGAESFVWMGRNTNLTERKTSISVIEVRNFSSDRLLVLFFLLNSCLLACMDRWLNVQEWSTLCWGIVIGDVLLV